MNRFSLFIGLLLLPLLSLAEAGKSQIELADPYILLEGDTYYAYGTRDANGIRCYSSTDLRSWKYEGLALHKDNTTETRWFWAPEVYHIRGQYIMYFSANEHLYVATATSPKGPFKQVGTYQMNDLIGDEKCIDSHVFIDEDSTAYIFFVRFNDGNCIWQARLADDFITPVKGTMRKCFAASQPWELIQARVCEGPNIIKHNRRYYLTYSANDYQSQDYAVGYATTTNIASGTWTKYTGNPILRRWDDLVGTGHHSLFYDKEGLLRIVFHAHNSTEKIHDRLMYIGTMQFRGSNLVMLNDPIIRPTLTTLPYNPELITQSWGFKQGGAATIDLNNNGCQDIVAGGISATVQNSATDDETSKRMSYLATFSPTTHKWAKGTIPPAFRVADSPSIVPCDINGDGNMDVVAFEQTGYDTSSEAYSSTYSREGIFLGNGNGTFRNAEPQLTQNGTVLPLSSLDGACNAEVIDIDNDGRLDIILAGHQGQTHCNVILHNQSNDSKSLCFNVEPYEPDYLLRQAIIQAADMNNDGLADFAISALVDGRDDQQCFTDIYLNDADHPGRFRRLGLGEEGADLKRKSGGALCLADFNDDGWTDILLSGLGEVSAGESTTRQRIYINQQTPVPSFKAISCEFQTDIYKNDMASQNSAGVIDWNADGTYDVLLGGIKGGNCCGTLYLNDGNGHLQRNATIPGATGASIIFPDYNGDGRKDFLLIGQSTDKNYLTTDQFGPCVILCSNLLSTPSRPEAPLAPSATVQDGSVKLSWQAPETAHPGFTYEIFIRDEQGNLLCSTPAFIGGTKDGTRKTNRAGRAGTLNHWTFRPFKAGTYTWGVQTVDASYTGSVFTEGPQFTVTEDDIANSLREIKNSPDAKNVKDAKVFNLAGQQISNRNLPNSQMPQGINIITEQTTTKKILRK